MIQAIGIGVRPEYSSAALVQPASQPLAGEQADWRVALCTWRIRTLPPVGDHKKAIVTFVTKEGESYEVPDARDMEGAPRLCEALLQGWGRPAVSEHAVNVDQFRHRPVRAVAALLPDRQSGESALGDLPAGIDTEHVRILFGEEGARILDRTGAEHGFLTHFVRALQSLGYDQNILAVYDEGLRSGQALVTVPCAPERRYEVGNVLWARGAHSIIYFGAGTAETLSGP